jgi:hypothetical protein
MDRILGVSLRPFLLLLPQIHPLCKTGGSTLVLPGVDFPLKKLYWEIFAVRLHALVAAIWLSFTLFVLYSLNQMPGLINSLFSSLSMPAVAMADFIFVRMEYLGP